MSTELDRLVDGDTESLQRLFDEKIRELLIPTELFKQSLLHFKGGGGPNKCVQPTPLRGWYRGENR